MRLPLLIEGNVKKIIDKCATVRLPAGKWKIIAENHLNSILAPAPGTVVEGGNLTMCFIEVGTETNLSIYAEKVA